jgi:hypothetical protein
VDIEPNDRGNLATACTLGPTEGAQRIREWRQLAATHGVGRASSAGSLTLRFRDDPGVQPRLEDLVAAERTCCPFLSWDLVEAPGEWQVVVVGDDDVMQTVSFGL